MSILFSSLQFISSLLHMDSTLRSFLFLQTPHSFLRLFSSCFPRKLCQYKEINHSFDMPHGVERSRSLHSALKKNNRTIDEKKVVHFADSMGLDLVQVKCVFPYNTSDEDILSSSIIIRPSTSNNKGISSITRLMPHSSSFNDARFLQLHPPKWPKSKDYQQIYRELIQRTKRNGICLKSSNVIGMTFTAVVSVYNYSYHKQVFVRYSLDEWRSHTEISARFISSSSQDNIDNFSFSLFLPHSIPIGAKCRFALRYKCGNREWWDNNEGDNFTIQCRTMADHYGGNINLIHDRPVFY